MIESTMPEPKTKFRTTEIEPMYNEIVKRSRKLAKAMQANESSTTLRELRVGVMDATADFLSIRTEAEMVEALASEGKTRAGWRKP